MAYAFFAIRSQRHSKRISVIFSFSSTYTRRKNAANTTLRAAKGAAKGQI